MDNAELVAAITRLERRDLAREVTALYARAIDTRDYDLLGDAFAADAVLEIPGLTVEGREAIVDWYRDYMESYMPGWMGRHLIVNHRFGAATEDELSVSSYYFVTFRGPTESILGWGRYDDRIVFPASGPQMSYKYIEVDSQSDVSEGWSL